MEDAGHEEVKVDVPQGYVLVMDDVSQTWEWPSSPADKGRYYITAKHPGLGEDKVRAASSPQFAVDAKAKTGDLRMTPSREAGFVEKCVQQIIGFAIPTSKDGEQAVAMWKPDNKGDNYPNRTIYTSLLRAAELRRDIEAFLDKVAGRDTDSMAAFAELGEGPAA